MRLGLNTTGLGIMIAALTCPFHKYLGCCWGDIVHFVTVYNLKVKKHFHTKLHTKVKKYILTFWETFLTLISAYNVKKIKI